MSRLLSRAIRVFFFEVTPLCWLVMAGTSKGTKPAHKVRNQRVPSCVIFFTRNWERPLYTMHTMCFGVILSDVFTQSHSFPSKIYSFRLKTITKNGKLSRSHLSNLTVCITKGPNSFKVYKVNSKGRCYPNLIKAGLMPTNWFIFIEI